MRWIGLDCHLEFIEVAIVDAAGALVSAGRIESSEDAIRPFAEGLAPDDRVALESSANAAAIAALIRPHVAKVVIANSRRLTQITQARAKTDRLDARTLAKLLRAGALEEVWMPDERTRARRRLCSRRAALVRARTRAKNEAHAVLARNLTGPPAGNGPLRPRGAALAGGPRAARRRAADPGCVPAPGRLPVDRDRRARAPGKRRSPRRRGCSPPVDDPRSGTPGDAGAPGGDRRGLALRLGAPARRLPGARSAGAPIGFGRGPPRQDLQAGTRPGAGDAGRGLPAGDAPAWTAAGLRGAGARAPRPSGGGGGGGAKARLPCLAAAHQGRGLRL
jgi:hypothetical protein